MGKRVNIVNLDSTREDLALEFKGIGVEIGVEQGAYSEIICQVDNVEKLYSIDAWKAYSRYRDHTRQQKLDNFYELSKKKLEPYNCVIIRKFSDDAAKDFLDESLDFVYIDANHDYEHVYNDIYVWIKKVKSGGIISGHDYTRRRGQDHLYAVIDAVNDFCEKNNILELFVYRKDQPASWKFIKK